MEIGNSKDIWFKNCVDLVLSRFCESDYAPFGITGVNVLKVMRIHNRLLQDRWEQQYEWKVMKSKKRHAEYLLYGEALQCPNEFQRILEEGFPFFRGLFNQGFPRPVLLSNSIGLADVQRLQALSEKWQIFNNGRIRASGWLLVVKAFLGYSAQDLTVNFASPTTKKCTYPGADSVYKLHPTDSNQCSWLVFDSSLVVPEYLLEFKYNFKHEAASADPIMLSQGDPKLQRSTSLKVLEEFLPRKGRGTWHCLPLDDPVRAAGKPKLLSDGIIDVHPRHSSIVSEIFCHLSSSLILRNSNIKDLSKVTHLNLHNCNITNIETLEGLKNLEVLLLSFNKVTRMKGFAQLEVLKKLDLSYNLVKRIEVVEAVSNLVRLDLAGNEISVIEDIERLHSQIPALLHLSLKNNPIEERIGYRQMVLKAVPSLVKLDGISVAAEERVEAIKMVRTDLLMMHNSSLRSHAISPNLTSLIPCDLGSTPTNAQAAKEFKVESIFSLEMQLTKDMKNEIWSKNNKRQSFGSQTFWEDENWLDGLEELHLESQQLKEMKGVGRLRSLRCLYLSDNEISVIEGLESCTLLEELLLDDNHIREANWLPQFQMLWKLDISKNHLTSCVFFSGMKSLTQLSIERNKIHSLKGLECLQCLMELYAAKNDILDIKELIHLRALSKLMVLDLSGNGVCECPGYRSYSIYTMRRLKVFDGRIVAHAEIHAAREVHAGRLTRDMLEQQLGHCNFHQIEVLDLSSKSLRHCGDVFESGDFFGLLDLNLNNNLLCSIQAVRKLTKLVCLQIENNKIENGRLVDYCITSEEGSFSCERVLTHHSYAEVSRQSSEYPTGKTSQGFGAKIGLDSVKYLYLGGNIITSIASLHLSATFSNLKLLSLKKNRIAKVDGLVGLKLIEILILDDNNIKEFEPLCFAGLGYLRELHMTNNALHTLGPLEHLSSLEKLDLASNHLTSNRLGGLSSVEGLALLPKLSDLKLANNPMSRQPHYRVTIVRRLLQLRYLDGKEIAEVERLEAENFSGSKVWPASVPYCMDPSSMLENSSCASTTSHLLPAKVPVKLTCLNFQAMCTPSPNLSSGQTVLIGKTVLAGGQSRSKCGEFWEIK